MLKKTITTITLVAVFLSVFNPLTVKAVSSEKNLLINGDFERMGRGYPLKWSLSGDAYLEVAAREPAAGAVDMIVNGGFEEAKFSYPVWEVVGNFTRDNTFSRNGNWSAKLTGSNSSNGTLTQYINNIAPSAEYQLSMWVYMDKAAVDAGSNVRVRVGYGRPGNNFHWLGGESLSEHHAFLSGGTSPEAGVWTQYLLNFTPNHAAGKLWLQLIVACPSGTVYIDDVSMYVITAPDRFALDTDDIFHYSDNNTGTATIKFNSYYGTFPSSTTVDLKITDGNTVVVQSLNNAMTSSMQSYNYDITPLKEKKEYILTATVKSGGNTYNYTQRIFKYPRPKKLTKDGVYMVDGKPFAPVIAYSAWSSNAGEHGGGNYPGLAEIGINVAVTTDVGAVSTILKQLDELDALGLKCMISLYRGRLSCGKGMLPPGHPRNIAHTKEIVTAVKDHPAVFAYYIMDEPHQNFMREELEDWLIESYRIIRDIDDNNPVFLAENTRSDFGTSGKMCDMLGIVVYTRAGGQNLQLVSIGIDTAREAVKYNKPVYPILQTFEWGNGWFPTVDDISEMIYRSVEGGAQGISYYAVGNAFGMFGGEKKHLYQTDLWKPLSELWEAELKQVLAEATVKSKKETSAWFTGQTRAFSEIISDTPEYNYLVLPKTGAKAEQMVYGIKPNTTYFITVWSKSSVADSVKLDVDFHISDGRWTQTGTMFSQVFGKADSEWHRTVIEVKTPSNANAFMLTLTARLNDAFLCIDNVHVGTSRPTVITAPTPETIQTEELITEPNEMSVETSQGVTEPIPVETTSGQAELFTLAETINQPEIVPTIPDPPPDYPENNRNFWWVLAFVPAVIIGARVVLMIVIRK
ncbi:MAG: hypothetical protein FWD34_00620 [Oscillospiraceae bacterium]|nr:hypothetical protein [Oscillospiraceae bacterium]